MHLSISCPTPHTHTPEGPHTPGGDLTFLLVHTPEGPHTPGGDFTFLLVPTPGANDIVNLLIDNCILSNKIALQVTSLMHEICA